MRAEFIKKMAYESRIMKKSMNEFKKNAIITLLTSGIVFIVVFRQYKMNKSYISKAIGSALCSIGNKLM